MTSRAAKRDAATSGAEHRDMGPPAPLGEGLARVLDARWAHYREQRERLLAQFSEPAVHDLRVALRRLMTVLDLLHRLRVPGRPRALNRRLKRRFKALSRLRDVQVERNMVADATAEALSDFSAHLETTEACLTEQARRQVAQGAAATAADHMARVRDGLARQNARAGGERRLARGIAREVKRLARRSQRRLRRVRARRPRTVHRLRLAFKAYRYALEAIAELRPWPGLEALLPHAKVWQTRMGEIQDSRVLMTELAAFRQGQTDHPGGLRKAGRRIKADRATALGDFCGRLEDLADFLEASRAAALAALQYKTQTPEGTAQAPAQPPHAD